MIFECSVHVSDGFPKKRSLDGGWVGGWGELYPTLLLLIFLTLQSPYAEVNMYLLTLVAFKCLLNCDRKKLVNICMNSPHDLSFPIILCMLCSHYTLYVPIILCMLWCTQ